LDPSTTPALVRGDSRTISPTPIQVKNGAAEDYKESNPIKEVSSPVQIRQKAKFLRPFDSQAAGPVHLNEEIEKLDKVEEVDGEGKSVHSSIEVIRKAAHNSKLKKLKSGE